MKDSQEYLIPSPPWTVQGKRIESTIRKALFEYKLLEGVDHVAVALSGGKDSLTLLLMLHAISGRGFQNFKVTALHVDGPVSCGAQIGSNFLRAFCEQLHIPLIVRTPASKEAPSECYSCSRERRKMLFAMAKESGCSTIAFGHHSDDHVQTLIMNLLHKGEFAGLLPKVHMIKYGITIIRPLFFVRESEIRNFAKASGFQRLTCNCPFGQQSMRKKTEILLEKMEDLYPNARVNLKRAVAQWGSTKALLT